MRHTFSSGDGMKTPFFSFQVSAGPQNKKSFCPYTGTKALKKLLRYHPN
jgi:hypothetical protein